MAEESQWNKQLAIEKSKYSDTLLRFSGLIDSDSRLKYIANAIIDSSASKNLNAAIFNAAWGGDNGDGGANNSIKEFITFLEGVVYAKYMNLNGPYAQLIEQHDFELREDYEKYLELKEKFEKLGRI